MNMLNRSAMKFAIIPVITGILCSSISCGSETGTTANIAPAATSNKEETATANQPDIHTAVMKNDLASIKKLITAKADLNKKESFGGSTALITAALFGKTEIAKLLIDANADLNIQNNDGSTALITAAFFCNTDIVRMLLDKKADRTIQNKYGQTAYQTVLSPFNEVKPTYDMLGKALAPMGLTMDYEHIRKARPVIANMLK